VFPCGPSGLQGFFSSYGFIFFELLACISFLFITFVPSKTINYQ
jgi:hypothetical protein